MTEQMKDWIIQERTSLPYSSIRKHVRDRRIQDICLIGLLNMMGGERSNAKRIQILKKYW